MRILILEDSPERHKKFRKFLHHHQVTIVATASEAITLLATKMWDCLFLDHDLGDQVMVESGPGTGYEVASWLEQHQDHMPDKVILHTFNPDGLERMQQALPQAIPYPGAWDNEKLGSFVQ
jgi:CheY-like chemotaxis protein